MQYQLDTIPVWDAYKTGGECPLCALRTQNEHMYVESFLGASVMEPSTRVEVNEKGFCGRHFAMMFAESNRLGLALITHTYMKDVIATVDAQLACPGEGGRFSLFRTNKGSDSLRAAGRIVDRINKCVMCERLDYTMHRYAYTLTHLHAHDADFRDLFAHSLGLCLPDLVLVLQMADEHLHEKPRQAFYAAVSALQKEHLSRIEKELEWFTLKFDYRNQDKPWGNSRDALARAIQKLSGTSVRQD